jgi:ketosteroid isomerase-like protein
MNSNVQLVSNFYAAFQQLDADRMNSCYSDDVAFFDPVFGLLEGEQVKYMWKMLCEKARDLSITYGNITELDAEYYTCDWTAKYTFSATGRPVVNHIKAHMKILDGKIIEHSDAFSLHKWSKQALGFSGWLLGWNRFYQQKIKNKARRNLLDYIEQHV